VPLPDFDFDALSHQERRQLADMLILKVVVDRGRGDERMRIEWRSLI
jgi:hypothetical protein